MQNERERIKEAIELAGTAVAPDISGQVAGVVQHVIETGAFPKEAMGFGPEKMEATYGQAYHLYNTGKYVEAIELFRLLTVLDPSDAKYALGLAACFHMRREYQNAVRAYLLAGILAPRNPIPQFHASDCYIQMNDLASAVLLLEMAVERAGSKAEYQVLKERALLTIESLKKKMS
jgi:type III secretion system low calcium response chaperone LcrH/SycD